MKKQSDLLRWCKYSPDRSAFSEFERAEIFSSLGEAYLESRAYDLALKHYQSALEIHGKNHHRDAARICYQMGMILEKQGKQEDALASYQNALAWQKKTGSHDDAGHIYYQIGHVFEARRKWHDAQANYKKSLECYEKTGSDTEKQNVLHRIEKVVKNQKKTNPYNNRNMLPGSPENRVIY